MLALATVALAQTPTTSENAAASITLRFITDDNNITAAEAGQTIPVTGTVVGGCVKVGDPVTVSLDDGFGATTTYTGLVVDLGNGVLGFSINVPGSALATDADLNIVASVTTTNAACNIVTATANQNFTVDADVRTTALEVAGIQRLAATGAGLNPTTLASSVTSTPTSTGSGSGSGGTASLH
jgi:hypothetical protein